MEKGILKIATHLSLYENKQAGLVIPAVCCDWSIVSMLLYFLQQLNQIHDGGGLRREGVIWPA